MTFFDKIYDVNVTSFRKQSLFLGRVHDVRVSDNSLLTEKRYHVVCFLLLHFFCLQLAVVNVDL